MGESGWVDEGTILARGGTRIGRNLRSKHHGSKCLWSKPDRRNDNSLAPTRSQICTTYATTYGLQCSPVLRGYTGQMFVRPVARFQPLGRSMAETCFFSNSPAVRQGLSRIQSLSHPFLLSHTYLSPGGRNQLPCLQKAQAVPKHRPPHQDNDARLHTRPSSQP